MSLRLLGGKHKFSSKKGQIVKKIGPRLLLQAALSLEVLHIHVAHHPVTAPPPGREISWQWQRSTFQHRHLKELVLAGFERMLRQISLERYLARVCKSLERVALLKDWCVREMGL